MNLVGLIQNYCKNAPVSFTFQAYDNFKLFSNVKKNLMSF